MTKILSFLFLSSFSQWAFTAEQKNKTLLILGDSLTEGYGVSQSAAFPALINEKLKKERVQWTVKAAGSSGSTSASGLERIKWLSKTKPDLILLLLGSNDGLRALKPEETEKNLNETVAWAVNNKIEIILGQLYVPPNYGKDYAKKFEALFKAVAKKNKVPLIPFLLDGVAGKSLLNQSDGIHPNEAGHVIAANNIYSALLKYLK